MFRAAFDGATIDLIRRKESDLRLLEEVVKSKNNRSRLRCTACNEPVHVRHGEVRVPHFAHIDRQAKDCPYLSFPAGFHKKAQVLTMLLADYVTKTYPDAQCDAEMYFNEYEIFFHLQVKFVQGSTLVFRFRRRNPDEKEWHEVPTSEVIPGAKTIVIIIGNPDKSRFSAQMYKDLIDPKLDQTPPFIYFSNGFLHVMDWSSRKITDIFPERYGFSPDGQIVITPEQPLKFKNGYSQEQVWANHLGIHEDDTEDNDDDVNESDEAESIEFDGLTNNDDRNGTWISDDLIRRMSDAHFAKYQRAKYEEDTSKFEEPEIIIEPKLEKTYQPVSGNYLCGHSGKSSVYCYDYEINDEQQKLFDRVCPACSIGSKYDEDKQLFDKLEQGPPKMYGSEKQISWVKNIQQNKLFNPIKIDSGLTQLADIIKLIRELHETCLQQERLRWYLAFVHLLIEKTSVQWWIDHQKDPISSYLAENNQLPARLI